MDNASTTVPASLGLTPVPGLDPVLQQQARQKIDGKTKPLGSLGRLEGLAIRLAAIQASLDPRVDSRLMLVFAADHGLCKEGISAFPQEVTVQMVRNFVAGGAAINVLCRQFAIDMAIVDAGVAGDLSDLSCLVHAKVAAGTRNSAEGPAMSRSEALAALALGVRVFNERHAARPVQLLGLGEMGIGNTSAAALLVAALTGTPIEDCVGRGTGLDDAGLNRKRAVLRRVFDLHDGAGLEPLEVLCRLGGLEIAAMAGAAMAAAASGVAVMLDGLISSAAGLVAEALQPGTRQYLLIGHRSVECGQAAAAASLDCQPILDLELRLGEGTGAAIAMNLAAAACSIMRDMASFESAGVSGQS